MQTKKRTGLKLAAAAALHLALSAAVFSQHAYAQQSAPGKNDAIYQYQGADREKRLVDNARKEGMLMWYTSMAPTEARPIAEAFEKKYGIKVELWRGPNEKLIQRAITEAKSHRHTFDVIETNATETEILSREGLLSAFHTPYAADFPAEAIPKHRMYLPDRFNYLVTAYNTHKVKAHDLPKTYEGFADPKWKGRVAIESGDWDWMATLNDTMGAQKGKAYFATLSEMRPDLRKGHPLLAQLVGAGEVEIGLTTFLSNVLSGKKHGTPIDFVPVQPVLAIPFGLGVAKYAPHPHAAVLFADFVLSPEGQEVLNKLGRLPASKTVKDSPVNFPYMVLDVDASLRNSGARETAWNELFIKR
jgi:iron(III) transport system substrate-binding protein